MVLHNPKRPLLDRGCESGCERPLLDGPFFQLRIVYIYIYIYMYIHTQNSIFGGSVLERFLDRFFNDF